MPSSGRLISQYIIVSGFALVALAGLWELCRLILSGPEAFFGHAVPYQGLLDVQVVADSLVYLAIA